jgi:ankyrin repeat protein
MLRARRPTTFSIYSICRDEIIMIHIFSNSIFQTFTGSRRRRLCSLVAGFGLLMLMPLMASAGAFEDFFKAAKMDNAGQISALLKRGLDPNLIEPERGDTGLILALREGSMKVFDLLVNARGTDIEIKARNGDTALMIAAFKGHRHAVDVLLAKGAQVNRPGWTALHYAAAGGHTEIVQTLLEKHAYIDAASPNRTTPIMMAAWGGHIYTVKLLLDEGADATLKNDIGMTAIDFAKSVGRHDIAEGLEFQLKKAGKL